MGQFLFMGVYSDAHLSVFFFFMAEQAINALPKRYFKKCVTKTLQKWYSAIITLFHLPSCRTAPRSYSLPIQHLLMCKRTALRASCCGLHPFALYVSSHEKAAELQPPQRIELKRITNNRILHTSTYIYINTNFASKYALFVLCTGHSPARKRITSINL